MPSNKVARLGDPFDAALDRFLADWSRRAIEQHAELFEREVKVIDDYMASPEGQDLQRDVAGYWRYERAKAHRHATHLRSRLASRPPPEPPRESPAEMAAKFAADPALATVREVLAAAGPPALFPLRSSLIALLQGQLSPITLSREKRVDKMRELAFVAFAIEHPEYVFTSKGTAP